MNDFKYNKISIPDWKSISGEIKEVSSTHGVDPGFRILDLSSTLGSMPCLSSWFSCVGMQPWQVCYISIAAGTVQQIHLDVGTSRIALNLPVSGCLGSHTRMYKFKGSVVTSFTPVTNLRFDRYVDNDPEEVDRFVLDAPTFINIKIPHSVVNPSSDNRVCLSFRFKPDPWHMISIRDP